MNPNFPIRIFRFNDACLPNWLKQYDGQKATLDLSSIRTEIGTGTVFITFFKGNAPNLSTRVPTDSLFWKQDTFVMCEKCKRTKKTQEETNIKFHHILASYCWRKKCKENEDHYEETYVDENNKPV